MKGIVPEKLKSITLGKLFAELNNIPTKISRIRRLLKSEKEKERIKDYELQMSVHEKELEERQQLLQQISNMPVDMVKMIMI